MYTTADAYRLAAMASVDYRTAARALAGQQVKGLAGERLRAALAGFKTGYPATVSGTAGVDPLAISSIKKPTL